MFGTEVKFSDVLNMKCSLFLFKRTTFGLLLFVSFLVICFELFVTNEPERKPMICKAEVKGWNFSTPRDVSLYIQPENETTLLLSTTFCKIPTSLLVVVCSAPHHFMLRRAIRETWGSTSGFYDFKVYVYFLLGETSNSSLQYEIEKEFFYYDDLIQEHFVDTYNNLTIKSLMMLKLVNAHCGESVKYVMKCDDDTYVNIAPLVRMLMGRDDTDFLSGYLMKLVEPVRNASSKWYAPNYLYYDDHYPNFLSGTGYVMSIDVVTKLYNASLFTPIFHLEDVYVTGILANKTHLTPRHNTAFSYMKRKFLACVYLTAVTSHRLDAREIRSLYSFIQSPNRKKECEKAKWPTFMKYLPFFGILDVL